MDEPVEAPESSDDDPTEENSMRWQTALAIFVIAFVVVDWVWGYSNRTCALSQMKLYGQTLQLRLDHAEQVQRTCNWWEQFGLSFGIPLGLESALWGVCYHLHPATQMTMTLNIKSTNHYDLAMDCVGRYVGMQTAGTFVAALVVTLANPHTRKIVPWVLRNPMGMEKN
eukprot:TRINITY_DN38236_c0_g1_i1.p1 TRINITY_DN38236_c0_g1~~TRINITY_DN38236_c0_g1_i1.p1  ORF type:complete len:181 (-),score=22.79 TRINITY_DN38236_c0_g1_i1:67-573(-)